MANQSARTVQVGDVIYTPPSTSSSGSHVELVTAVIRDENGRVASVRVDESRPPTTATKTYTAEKFDAHLAARKKQLLHISDREAWHQGNRAESFLFPNPESDAIKPKINRSLLLDLGDWVPYQRGESGKFNVMDRDSLGLKTLVIRRDDETMESIPLSKTGIIERTLDVYGDYTAYVEHADGSNSNVCEFAICDMDIRLPGTSVSIAQAWDVEVSSENINIIAVYLWNEADTYGRHLLFLTSQQQESGLVTVPAGLLQKTGTIQVWLIGEHPLGRLKLRKEIKLVD